MPDKKACCDASFQFAGKWLDAPLCESCANAKYTEIRVALYLCLLQKLHNKDIVRLICRAYVNNPFVMNPVSRFLAQGNDTFLFVRGKHKLLERALYATHQRWSAYEDSKWAEIIIIRNGHDFPTDLFMKFALHVRLSHLPRKVIICGKRKAGGGLFHSIPNILVNTQII